MKKSYLIFTVLVLSACGCRHDQHSSAKVVNAVIKTKPTPDNTIKTIDIQPFADMPMSLSKYIYARLVSIYPNTKLVAPVPLPAGAYYKARNRYRADTIIERLQKTTPAQHITLGLTTKDISCDKDKFADFGIFGLSYQPGKACVASIFRLKQNRDKFFKVAIHELGHSAGLPHCPVKICFMRDAEGHDFLDQEKEFCPKCKTVLREAGWKI